jgi:hypothetical protein
MKQIHSLLCLLLLVVSFIACESNDDSNRNSQNDDTFAQNFGNSVSKDFIGQVVDVDNHPIQNAEIKIGTSTVQTDINGVFIINGASVFQRFAYITAKKAGFIDGSRSMVPTTGKNNVKIMLLPNSPLQTIQSGVSSEVSLPSGTKVNFDGAFENESGNAYSGTVNVSMFHLLPSNENISKMMPGMLYAQTATNQPVVLETYGMLNVELRGSAGEKLNIKEGHTAEITLKIDDSQTATAPSSIPLWHFDEEKGYWKEDGVATKVGNNYVGEVSHFSWWNCDAFLSTVNLTVTVVNSSGNPLSNLQVGLSPAGSIYPRYGTTDNNGQVSGFIPANQPLTLNVFVECGIIYTTTIGPFSTNTILPNVVITNSSTAVSTNVIGSLLKCDNTNVNNGYVLLSRNGSYSFSPVTSGAFSFNEVYCGGETAFTLKGVDLDNLQETGAISYNFTAPVTTVGNLQSCNALSEFISYQIDTDLPIILTNQVNGGIDPNISQAIIVNGSTNSTPAQMGFAMVIFNQGLGVFDGNSFTINAIGIENGTIGGTATATVFLNFSAFGNIGEYIDMTFYGTYPDSSGVTHTLNGVIHVIRNN